MEKTLMARKTPYTAEEIFKKYNKAKVRHLKWFGLAAQAFAYVTPERNSLNQFYEYVDAGVPLVDKIYCSIPMTAAILRSNKLTRMLMPDNERWGSMELDTDVLQERGVVTSLTDSDMDVAMDVMYRYIGGSNLAQQVQDAMLDETVGAGAIWVESPGDDDPLEYSSVPGFCVMPEYYQGGKLMDLHYAFSCSADFVEANYPDAMERSEISMRLLDHEKDNGEKPIWIHRSILWDFDPDYGFSRWRTVDVLGASSDEDSILSSYYTDYKKLKYFRSRIRPGEVNGRGPGLNYLPEIKRLNELSKLTDMADELRAFPPVEGKAENFTSTMITQMSGSVFPEGTVSRFWELPPSPEVTEKIQTLGQRIEKGFAVEAIGGLNQPVRTAEEVSARLDAAEANTTIDVSRLLKESSAAIFETTFDILLARGKIPKSSEFIKLRRDAPDALAFSYINPLGDVQKNNNLLKTQRTLQMYQQYMGPDSFAAVFNLSDLQDFLADNSGLPESLFVNGTEMQQKLESAVNSSQQSNPTGPATQPTGQQVDPLQPEGTAI